MNRAIPRQLVVLGQAVHELGQKKHQRQLGPFMNVLTRLISISRRIRLALTRLNPKPHV